ncbi:MAG: stage II sporulation protein P [Clostridia bacterium]|nr:stage II sporulation protein P [Clostridia bacterium]
MPENTKEELILELPAPEEVEKVLALPPKKHIFIKIIALTLALISIAFHVALIARAVELIKKEGSEILFSAVVPEYEISRPATPAPPEGELIEKDPEELTDPPLDVLIREGELSANAEYGFSLSNETGYSPDLLAIAGLPSPAMSSRAIEEKYGKSGPKVLIYHTHATEAFVDCAKDNFRSADAENSIIAVGKIICQVLERSGISTLHLTDRFDEKNFSSAYDTSHEKVKKALEKYPSIQYVFDVHRDCIGNSEEGYLKSTCDVYGKAAAQLMFVCGTDEGGSGHTSWRDNLTVALHLQKNLWQSYDRLVRPINLRRASFYQNTRPAALLLECGTCANTLQESKRAAVLFAVTLSNYIKGKDCGLDTEELIRTLCP